MTFRLRTLLLALVPLTLSASAVVAVTTGWVRTAAVLAVAALVSCVVFDR